MFRHLRDKTAAALELLVVLYITGVFAPLQALAQISPPGFIADDFSELEAIIRKVISWFFTLIIFISVIYVLYGAFLYMTSSGEPERVKKANKTLTFAAIAIAVALLAWSIVYLVGGFFNVRQNLPTP